ncbi:MAG: right-handed parallel beta-helix repeat-containing protein, partial [Planctomycetes bacterium]|nr:right-handed parallel beta-helix repeat-containing protein [Planctomycetota bacterium]
NDCNGNGICDDVELATGIAQDCNGNGVPDDCDGDCNGNGAADECDIAQGVSQDCTGNGVPDECESDCNANGFADSCDILDGTSMDDNGDGFPDECQQPLLYVDSTATGANDGTSWSDAFVSPHDAFDLARDPRVGVQEIWVRAAVYKPDVPNGDRERTFRLPNGVGVYGGFAGWETKRDERDPRQNETVFSGDLNGNDDSTDGTRFDNSYHVVTVVGPDVSTPTVFDGFVVKSGSNADAPPLSRQGAGMQISGAAPIIRNCLFTENRGHSGAGLKITSESSPLVSRCRFIGNIVSAGSGGAIAMNFGGRLDLRDSVFIGNAATQQGSAILATASSVVTISHCTFLDNPALAPQAGVIANRLDSRIDIVGSIIWDTLGSPDLLSVGTLDYPSTLTVQHSVVRGGIGSAHVEVDSIFIWGDGNIDQDPLLDADGVHLLALSPCIGRGDPARERSSLDIDGEPRVQFCRADMGADETDFMLDCNGNGQADACDVAAGTSEDINRNGRPDECETHLSYVDVNNCPGPGSGTLADPFCEIQSALDGDGMEAGTILDIVVADGVYVGPNNRDLNFGGRVMRLRSANGPQNCIIDAGGGGRVAYFPNGLGGLSILDGFTIQGGSAAVGGGIYVQNARSLIRNCIVKNNTAGAGGGIMIQGGGTEILNCVVTDNQADFGGGIRIEQQGFTPRILGCAIRDNIAAHGGGVSCEGGGGWFEGCTISGNRANAVGLAEGGGVWLTDSSTSFVGCTIEDNSAAAGDTGFGSGGGVFIFAAGTTTLEGCTIRNNAAGGPGGIFIEDRKGGGLYILGGGFFFGQPNIAVRDCAISGNTARLGGGVYVRGAEPTIERCVIADNTALPFGTFGHGGGVYALNVDASFQDCTIRRNAAENGEGGGGHNSNGTLGFVQCQITGNEAAVGGGIYTRAVGVTYNLSFMSGLIYGNTAGSDGGGIFVRSSLGGTQVLDLSNSILWGNSGSGSTEDNQLGFFCTSTCENIIGYNCVQGWTGALGGDGNFGDDPGFVDPDGEDDRLGTGDDDLRVHVGSPVIDAGDNLSVPSNLTADFAGNPRFVDDPVAPDTGRGTPPIVDIGAFEGGLDCNGNGVSDLDDVANGTSQDCTGNGVPDECELDCDGNAVADICDILDGTSADCNENGLTDVCEIEQSGLADCDGNGIPDECEDTTNDCNNNGVWDECDLAEGTSQDCNETGIPDECETDCNANGLSDDCDIENGTSFDDDANGIPDECERPPLQALPPHEIQKNRYVSFTPNAAVAVAYRIEGLTNAYFPDVVGVLGWVDMPDEDGLSLIAQDPVYRDDWPSVVHLGDCAIVPVATYAVSATTNGVHFSDSLTIETVGQPGGGNFWADTVGFFDGTQWTPPQGVTNIDDAVAAIRSFQAADGAPHVSVTDVEPQHLNRVVNIADVLQIVRAFQGNRYPFGCPDDPCRDNLATPCP